MSAATPQQTTPKLRGSVKAAFSIYSSCLVRLGFEVSSPLECTHNAYQKAAVYVLSGQLI
jgi:hypothetical protein